MNTYIITTQRLGLRRWVEDDIGPFTAMNKDPDVMEFFPKALTATESRELADRIDRHFHEHQFGLFAVEHKLSRQFIGYTGFAIPGFESFFTPCVEIGWRFEKNSWGKGFATEAAKACLDYGFNELKLDRIVSFTASVNIRSERVMQRIGMSFVTGFDHPKLDAHSILRRHVLYEILHQTP